MLIHSHLFPVYLFINTGLLCFSTGDPVVCCLPRLCLQGYWNVESLLKHGSVNSTFSCNFQWTQVFLDTKVKAEEKCSVGFSELHNI